MNRNKEKKFGIARTLAVIAGLFIFGFGIGYVISLFYSRPLKDGEYNILVCSTTDVHGMYFNEDYDGNERNASMADVASYLAFLRSNGLDPVVVDAGDALQGDNASYYYNYVDTVSEHVFASMEKYLRYDALVVGNHDIEAGHSVYDRMKLSYGVPFLAANAVRSEGEDAGKPYFQPYAVMNRSGVRIAVIGMTNGNIKNWLSEELWKGIDFKMVSEVAQQWVDKVRDEENPDVVILALHCGAGNGEGPDIESEGLYVASRIKGVDLVILGHDHTARAESVSNPAGDVFVINAGSQARGVAQAVISLKVEDGKIVSRSTVGAVIDMDPYPADSTFLAQFSAAFNTVDSFACAPVGSIASPMSFEGVLDAPTEVMNLVHDVQLKYSGADISISAPLATKGEIPSGEVSFKDLAKIYRFENHLFKVEMSGRQIKGFLEMAYYNNINKIGPSYNYDSAAGINYEVSLSAPRGEKLNIISLSDGTPFSLDSTYTVAMNSYRANGGGYLLRDGAGIEPSELKILEKYKDIRSMIGDYISELGEYVPVKPDNWKFVR